LGARYVLDGTAYRRTDVIFYDRVLGGTIGGGRTSVELGGYRIDSAGTRFAVQLSQRDIPLAVFGGTTFYEGYREKIVSPGVSIANDNLQQFVRRIDLNDRGARMTFWAFRPPNTQRRRCRRTPS